QHGEFHSCRMFRKFAAWSGAALGIPEDLEDRLRRFESIAEFEALVAEIRLRHGTRRDKRPTAEIKVPNGPVEYCGSDFGVAISECGFNALEAPQPTSIQPKPIAMRSTLTQPRFAIGCAATHHFNRRSASADDMLRVRRHFFR